MAALISRADLTSGEHMECKLVIYSLLCGD